MLTGRELQEKTGNCPAQYPLRAGPDLLPNPRAGEVDSARDGMPELEAEPGRQRDGTSGQSGARPAETRSINSIDWVSDVVHDTVRFEVQIVEQIISIDAELKPGVLAEYRHVGKAKGFR